MSPHEMENVVHFTVDHYMRKEALYQLRFEWPISDRPKGRYPVCFNADDVSRYNLLDSVRVDEEPPVFADGDSTIVRCLVASLIKDGHTGVHTVVVASSRVVKVYYDPKAYPPHLIKNDINVILRDVDRHGWTIRLGW